MFPFEETVPQMKLAIPSRGQSGKSYSSKLYLILQGGGCPPYHLNNFGHGSLRTGETNNCLYNVIMFTVWFALLYCTGSLAGLRVLMHRRSLFFICFFLQQLYFTLFNLFLVYSIYKSNVF